MSPFDGSQHGQDSGVASIVEVMSSEHIGGGDTCQIYPSCLKLVSNRLPLCNQSQGTTPEVLYYEIVTPCASDTTAGSSAKGLTQD